MSEQGKHDGTAPKPLLKLLVELGPLIAFFLVYSRAGIYWATGVLMVATVLSLIASWSLFGRLLAMPVVTAVLVVVFGEALRRLKPAATASRRQKQVASTTSRDRSGELAQAGSWAWA